MLREPTKPVKLTHTIGEESPNPNLANVDKISDSATNTGVDVAPTPTATNKPQTPPKRNPPTKMSPLIIVLTIVLILLVLLGVVTIALTRNGQPPVVGPTPTLAPDQPTPIPTPDFRQNVFERTPTTNTLNVVTYIRYQGSTSKEDVFTGSFTEGLAYNFPATAYPNEDVRLNYIQSLSNAQKSLVVLEARDASDQTIYTMPIGTGKSDSILGETYNQPGPFTVAAILPVGTNSVVLRVRDGNTLDRVYVESWQPTIEFDELPQEIGRTETINLNANLAPSDKAFTYKVDIVSIDQTYRTTIINPTSPASGGQTISINLADFTGISSNSYRFEAIAQTAFREYGTFITNNFLISENVNNQNITITNPNRRLSYTAGERSYFYWQHNLSGVPLTGDLDPLCKDKGICYDLVFVGDNIMFIDKPIAQADPTCGDDVWCYKPSNKLNTRINDIECLFQGSGEQKLTLMVLRNGAYLGETSLTFNITGGEPTDEPSLCYISPFSY